jgi:iron complex transport system substrate-binding protein
LIGNARRNRPPAQEHIVNFIVLFLMLFGLQSSLLAEPFPVSLSDALGRQTTLDKVPMRIISLAPSNTEILFALGLGDRVVGVTDYCDFPAEALTRTKIGGFSNPNLEQIVSLSPDLVLAARFNPIEVLDALHELGFPVFALAPSTLDEALQTVEQIGQLTGSKPESLELLIRLRERVAHVEAVVRKIPSDERPKILWGQLKAPMYSAGPGSFIHDLVTRAGGQNIAADTGAAWPQLGLETLVTRNPDIIIVSGQDSVSIRKSVKRLRQVAGWNSIAAIVTGKVYEISLDLLGRPGPRLVSGLESLASLLHPEKFTR